METSADNRKERALPIIRIEAVEDPKTGRFLVEIYHPAEAAQHFVTTEPRYTSAAAAEHDVIAILAAAANRPRDQGPTSL
jgi:hypothetical protein